MTPPTLTEEERRAYDEAQGFVLNVAGREMVGDPVGADEGRSARLVAKLLNAIDRLSGSALA